MLQKMSNIKNIPVKVFRAHPSAIIPTAATQGSAGLDLYANEYVKIRPRDTVSIGTGLIFSIPAGYEVQIRSRSGLAFKHSVFVINSPGTIDSDYRGEVRVLLHNSGLDAYEVHVGERIAQMLIKEVLVPDFVEVRSEADLGDSERGSGGFGSTGS